MSQRAFIILSLALVFQWPAYAEEHGSEGEYYEDAPEGYQGDDNFNSGYDSNFENQIDLETFNLFEEMRLKPQAQPVAVEEDQAMPAIETTVQFELRRAGEEKVKKVLSSGANALRLNSAEAKPAAISAVPASATATATATIFLSSFPTLVNKPVERATEKKEESLLAPPPEGKSAVLEEGRSVRKYQKVLYVPSNGIGVEIPRSAFKKKQTPGFSAQLNRVWNRLAGNSRKPEDDVLPALVDAENADFEGELSNVVDDHVERDVSSASLMLAGHEEGNAFPFPLWILIVPVLLAAAFFAGRWDTHRRLGVSVVAKVPRKEEDTFSGTIFHKLKK